VSAKTFARPNEGRLWGNLNSGFGSRVKVPATAKQSFPRLIPKDIQGTHKHNWRLSRRNFVKRQGAGKVRQERRLDIPRKYASIVDTITALTTELFKVVNGKEVNVRCVVPLVR
jgi:hypothetical protein